MKTNKWKMALLVWSAMFPFSTAMTYGLARLPFTAHWPLVARTFCLTCLLVPYMVWVALPFLTQRFQKWLHRTPQETNSQVVQSQQSVPDRAANSHSETSRVTREPYAIL